MVTMILAVSDNGVIGLNGQIPWHLPEDLKRFKSITTGGTVIMGRKTLESLPNSKPLPNRFNIVLSSGETEESENLAVARSLEEAIQLAESKGNPIFIIGGSEVYKKALEMDLVDEIQLTLVHDQFKGDAFFDFQLMTKFKNVHRGPTNFNGTLLYTYRTLRK